MSLQLARQKAAEALAAIDAAIDAQQAPPAPQAAPVVFTAPGGGLSNPPAFYDVLRSSHVLGPTLTENEVTGTNAILAACAGVMPTSWAAYALATAYHETAHTMLPIKEYGGEAYYRRMYDIEGQRPAKARELGNTVPGDGAEFCGRGYVQLTGRANYAKAAEKTGADLIGNPDLAMDPGVAAQIMVKGMLEGWFTGKSLRTYLKNPADLAQFTAARRIINGQDKAQMIAGYAEVFQKALTAGKWV